MRRRLTLRTVAVSVLIVAVVAVVLGALAIAIGRQRDAGQRARHSQSVIAAANLTQQRLLAVQTTIRGFLIRGNADLLRGLPGRARGPSGGGARAAAARRARPRAAPARRADPRAGARLREHLRRPGDRAHARGGRPRRALVRLRIRGRHAGRRPDRPDRPAGRRGARRSRRAGRRRRRGLGPRAADRLARARGLRARAGAGDGLRRAPDRDAGRAARRRRGARPAWRARRLGPGAQRRRDRAARWRLQRDGARVGTEPRGAREPEHGARAAGDRPRGALRPSWPRPATRPAPSATSSSTRRCSWRWRSAARSATATSPNGSPRRSRGRPGPDRARDPGRAPRARTSACCTRRAGATTRAGRAPRSSGSIPPAWPSTWSRAARERRAGRRRSDVVLVLDDAPGCASAARWRASSPCAGSSTCR